jgi:hypothetical protein
MDACANQNQELKAKFCKGKSAGKNCHDQARVHRQENAVRTVPKWERCDSGRKNEQTYRKSEHGNSADE